jgi:hypothetical protein
LTDVGTAFAFSHKFLFTAFHVVEEHDPEFEVDGIYISEPLNPLKFIHEVKVVGMSKELDVAVLECLPVHFFRLPLRCTALQSFSSVYTVQRTESATTTVHCGRAYPGADVMLPPNKVVLEGLYWTDTARLLGCSKAEMEKLTVSS